MKRSLALLKGVMSLHKGIVLLSIAVVALIVIASLLVQRSIRLETEKDVEQSLLAVLDTSHQAMHSWLKQHKPFALAWANTAEIRSATRMLLANHADRESLMAAPAQASLHSSLRPVLRSNTYTGYALIDRNGVTLAASREYDIGGKSTLLGQFEFLRNMFSGGAALSLPQTDNYPPSSLEGGPDQPAVAMFVGAPIRDDEDQFVATLVLQLEIEKNLAAILHQGRIGASGETYAFNSEGYLISASRFEEQLRGAGRVSPDQHSTLNIQLRDPGVDLTPDKPKQTPTSELPLTYMAREALAGRSGTNMAGYRDYRGIEVVGAWMWEPELNFGIATELDRNEAYRAMDFSLNAIYVLTVFCCMLVFGLMAIYLFGRHLTAAAGRHLRQIVDLVPNMILVADQGGRILLANKALAKASDTSVHALQKSTSKDLRGQNAVTAAMIADSGVGSTGIERMLTSEERFLDPHGEPRIMERNRIIYQTDVGLQKAVLTVATDVTAQKNMETALRESEQFARSVLGSLAPHIAVLNRQGEIRAVNDAWRRFAQENEYPLHGDTWVGINYLDVCRRAQGPYSREAQKAFAGIQSVINGKASSFTLEYPCHSPDQQRWFLVSASPFAGRHGGAVVSHLDITERKLAEIELTRHRNELEKLVEERNRDLYLSEQNLRSIVESALGLILWLSPEGRIVGFNPEVERLFEKTPAEMMGKSYVDTLVPQNERQAIHAVIHKALGGHPTRNLEYSIQLPGDHRRTLTWNLDRILGPDGEPTGIIAVGLDITTIKEAEQRLQHLAHYDQLTGLPNRMLFHDSLRAALARARRHEKQFAVLYVDLDSFKQVNDTLGHSSGDQLLATTAERLKGCVREEDTVARLGGDEFAVILEDLDDTRLARILTERMLDVLQTELVIDGNRLQVSGSIGVAMYPANGADGDTILRHADHAMYCAKRSGKHGYRFFDPEMNARHAHRIRLESDLRSAIGTEQLFVQYQPKIDLDTGQVVGTEALARWTHPAVGVISPAQFIYVAEETGIITALGRFVMENACQTARRWQTRWGLNLPVAVNLSARQFRQEDIVDDIRNVLNQTGLPPHMLELELTESSLMEDMDRTVATFDALKPMGVKVAIDDFGSGYSSLSYLKKLPVDVVKIDQSFVRDIPTDADDRIIVSAIISLAHSLNHKVVAEGVEKAEQVEFLKHRGCDEIQGFYISPPVHPQDLTAAIETIESISL